MPAQATEEDVTLKILHTADWHLGKAFPEFDPEDRQKLTRARLNAVEQVFVEAESAAVDAVLCAGDVFDEPNPREEWWRPLLELLQKRTRPGRPIVLLPGNHDPLTEKSVYSPGHPFRQQLPPGAYMVDREDFTLELGAEKQAVLYAIPCRSQAGANDPTEKFPARAAGDERIRIGMAHGQTFDIKGYQMNFPIRPENAKTRGLDYLALGDTHAFRNQGDDEVPVVYASAPEQTRFGKKRRGSRCWSTSGGAGPDRSSNRGRSGGWQWRDEFCTSLSQLERLLHEVGPNTVLRLKLMMSVTLAELDQVEKRLVELRGSPALVGKAGIVRVERSGLARKPASDSEFPADMPDVLKSALKSLQAHKDQELRTGHLSSLSTGDAMRLIRLEVKNFAGIGSAAIEFGPGLNVLYGPNELGKSSLVDAVRAALLVQHNSKFAEAWVPWNTERLPEVELVLETEPQQIWRVQKTFGDKGKSRLDASKDAVNFSKECEGRAVHGKLRSLLRWGVPENAKGLPESFLIHATLPPQDRVTEFLEHGLDKDADPSARDWLHQVLQAVAADPLFKKVLNEATDKFREAFTPAGNYSRSQTSPLVKISGELGEINRLVAAAQKDWQETETVHNDIQQKKEEHLELEANLQDETHRLALLRQGMELQGKVREAREACRKIEEEQKQLAKVKELEAKAEQETERLKAARQAAVAALTQAESEHNTAREAAARLASEGAEATRQVQQKTLENDHLALQGQMQSFESRGERFQRAASIAAKAAKTTEELAKSDEEHTALADDLAKQTAAVEACSAASRPGSPGARQMRPWRDSLAVSPMSMAGRARRSKGGSRSRRSKKSLPNGISQWRISSKPSGVWPAIWRLPSGC